MRKKLVDGREMKSDTIRLIWEYEKGTMQTDQALDMFRRLVRSGEIWMLPQHYIEQAKKMIDLGYLNGGGN